LKIYNDISNKMEKRKVRLGVNIDHVATIRNARGGAHPSPVKAAILAQKFGANGITIHLREDRRHIRDNDLKEIKSAINLPINLEMAATSEMLRIAIDLSPNAVCIVPEKRQELTTEGGLDLIKNAEILTPIIKKLKENNIKISLFIDANLDQISMAAKLGADIIELHTGKFCFEFEANSQNAEDEFLKLKNAAEFGENLGIEIHAGHGLNYESAAKIVEISCIKELNIGHFLIGEAIFDGFEKVIQKMKVVIG